MIKRYFFFLLSQFFFSHNQSNQTDPKLKIVIKPQDLNVKFTQNDRLSYNPKHRLVENRS